MCGCADAKSTAIATTATRATAQRPATLSHSNVCLVRQKIAALPPRRAAWGCAMRPTAFAKPSPVPTARPAVTATLAQEPTPASTVSAWDPIPSCAPPVMRAMRPECVIHKRARAAILRGPTEQRATIRTHARKPTVAKAARAPGATRLFARPPMYVTCLAFATEPPAHARFQTHPTAHNATTRTCARAQTRAKAVLAVAATPLCAWPKTSVIAWAPAVLARGRVATR